MKKLLTILIVALLFHLINVQTTLAQDDKKKMSIDSFEMDLVKVPVAPLDLKMLTAGIEKEIYDQLDRAANAATYPTIPDYRSYLIPDATASSQGLYFYTQTHQVDSIIKPALHSYDHYSNYTSSNIVNVIDARSADQTVIINLFTDTTGHTPSYKLLRMNINWVKPSATWKIRNMDRHLDL